MTDPLFSSCDLKGHTLRNRLAVAPMTRVSAEENGFPGDRMAPYYARFANGGFGMVVTEGLYLDRAYSQTYPLQPGLADDAQAAAMAPVVDAIKGGGALAIAQVQHSGGLAQSARFRSGNIAPSVVQPKGEELAFYYGNGPYALPEEITDEQIEGVIADFASAAVRAATISGFDGIEVHGANGYLLDQFLTDYSNLRTDRWGGSTANRIALAIEVVKAVRKAVGSKVPVGIRISQGKVNDYLHKWAGGEADAEIIFGGLSDAGADFIHVTEFEAWKPAFGTGPSLVTFARRYAPGAAIIANGSLHDPDRARAVLDDGADILTLGRGALANPDLPNRLKKGAPLREFDPSILGPIANIKESELAL